MNYRIIRIIISFILFLIISSWITFQLKIEMKNYECSLVCKDEYHVIYVFEKPNDYSFFICQCKNDSGKWNQIYL